MNGNVFVFRPGGSPGGNVFTDWPSLITAMSGVEGRKLLEFDDSLVAPAHACEVPAGTWPMKDVMWAGFGPRPGIPRTIVHILSGAVFTDLRMIGGQITIVNQATGAAPAPVSDFSNKVDQVHIGLRDDCGNPQLVNQGNIPMFELGHNSAIFFIQNCLFGMPTPDVPNPQPLIHLAGSNSQLILNLLGQNQTGPNVVQSEDGATVLFGALSSAAQIAVKQEKISSDSKLNFGPQGRIQRLVIPRPPAPPATANQAFSTPNVLVRCDGTHPFTQELPSIRAGFTIGLSSGVNLYTGGQEVVVAEVIGGKHLKVRPAPGDTIDGSPNPVPIRHHGSRTFVSDGESNWITISHVHEL
jgi:hypothetical protein